MAYKKEAHDDFKGLQTIYKTQQFYIARQWKEGFSSEYKEEISNNNVMKKKKS